MAIYKKKKKSILESILSYLTKKGNKKIAVKLFQTALFNCSKKLKIKCKYFL